MRYSWSKFLLAPVFCAAVLAGEAQTKSGTSPSWEELDKRAVPAWFQNAKLGIFIHWGLYSVPAWATNSNADGFGSGYSEWYWERLNNKKLNIHKEFTAFHEKNYGPGFKYQSFAPMFKAELFNPDQWAELFQKAGARYVVLTSKHHDGYALWPSMQAVNWNAVDNGPGRDLAGEVSASVRKKGLKMGFYYSLYEWYNPLYRSDVNKYVDQHMLPQLKDLVNRYKPDIVWPDGEWDHSDTVWRSREFINWLYTASPVKDSVVINDRWGSGRKYGGYNTTEYGHGEASSARPWEECRGIGESFGYSRNENLDQYLTSKALIALLIDVVSRGGNLLLNIGPDADGTIPVIMQQRLMDLGKWLNINGEAIYDTRYTSAFKSDKEKGEFFTQKGKDIYLIATEWKNEWVISGISKPTDVSLLGFNGKLETKFSKGKLRIRVPEINPGNNPSEYAWAFRLKGANP